MKRRTYTHREPPAHGQKPRSSAKETLLRLARGVDGGIVTAALAAALLGISEAAARTTLQRLCRGGWISRLRQGVYLVLPLEAKAGTGDAVEDAWVLASSLFKPCYIGGWSAAEHWGLTEQIFRSTFVVTAASVRGKDAIVGGVEFRLARVPAPRLEGSTLIWRGPVRVPASDRERTIVDALVSPGWVGGIRHLVAIIRAYRESPEWRPERLSQRLTERASGAAWKRFGFIAESGLDLGASLIAEALTHRSRGIVRLDPGIASRGRMNKRWGLWVNVPVER
jgi:predicted transcriptional regulator of viral defense system